MSKVGADGSWASDELMRMKDNCDKAGMTFEAIRMDSEYIMLRSGSDRDRRLDAIMGNIEKASKAGVKVITHHWTVIPIRRNSQTPGRGGSTYAAFKLEDNWKDLPVGQAGKVSSDDYWERITHFVQKVIPVCKQYDVRMAAHPYDPPGLPFGYQGAENWDSPSIFEGYKRYEAIVDSPYNGFQLCLGTTAEGLKNPSAEVLPIVQYLAGRGKIHQIHMRNIRGGLNNFAEVYPDEGEMDFLKIMRILRDSQFSMSICPDHMPGHPEDPGKAPGFCFWLWLYQGVDSRGEFGGLAASMGPKMILVTRPRLWHSGINESTKCLDTKCLELWVRRKRGNSVLVFPVWSKNQATRE